MRDLLLFFALFCLTILGNLSHVNILYGTDFLFGSIGILLITYRFGTVSGILCALFSSFYTYFLWGHPYSIFIYALEAGFVGSLLKPARKNLLLLDGLFWVSVGMPLVWFFHFVVMHVEMSETLFVTLVHGVNGIANAVIANFLVACLPFPQRLLHPGNLRKDRLHETLFNVMVTAVIMPALIVSVLNAGKEKERIESEAIHRLEEKTSDVLAYLRSWLQLHYHTVSGLVMGAVQSEMTPGDELERYVDLLMSAYPDIRLFKIVDEKGKVVEVYPHTAEKGEPHIGLDLSTLANQEEMLEAGDPLLSVFYMRKGDDYLPLVTLSMPIHDGNALVGYAMGAFDLRLVKEYLPPGETRTLLEITLVDAQNRVLAASNPSRKPKDLFELHQEGDTFDRVRGSVHQWIPHGRRAPAVKGWTSTSFVQEAAVSPETSWKVIVEMPLAPQQRHLFARYMRNFATMMILSLLSLPLALLLSRRIVKPLEDLAEVTTNLPEKLLEQRNVEWPESENAEIHSLVANFQIMSRALEDHFQQLSKRSMELEQINAELKSKILEREKVEEALRESEERYREMADLLPQPVFEMNLEGVLTFINRAGRETFGYTMEEAPHELNAVHWLAPEDQHEAETIIRALLEKAPGKTERNLRRKDGTVFPAIVYSSPVRRGGAVCGLRGIVLDLTEQKEAEIELLTRQKLESLGVLAGGIAHDYNNILTGILGNISLAKMFASPGDRIVKRLEQAEVAATRAKTLTQQLLTFARGGTPVKKTVSMASLLEESVRFALRGSNVRCEFSIAPDLHAAEVDEGQISHAIHNIVMNAVQAMPEGGVIQILAENHLVHTGRGLPLEPGPYLMISIRDEGYGIPREHLSRIFDPYFTTKQKGSGLGLATAYSIIKKHGGIITAESILGLGSVFTLYLPASEKEVPSTVDSLPVMTDGHYRVLIMDDEEVVREVVGEMLEQMGYEVSFAKDGAEAVEAYRLSMEQGRTFDAVIMDLTIPGGMGGREAILKLLEIDPHIKAIVSSGYSGDVVMSHYASFGFRGVVPKPFKMSELSRVLKEVITRGNASP